MSPLDRIWAKSRVRPGDLRGELLTEHLAATRDAARMLQLRTGTVPGAPEYFWECVILACLLHDAGKVPAGFQQMVGNPGPAVPWGQRHEVYSLGFAAHVLAVLPAVELNLVMTGVASHHWPFEADERRSLSGLLSTTHRSAQDLEAAIGPVDPIAAGALHTWLQAEAGVPGTPSPSLDQLSSAAHRGLSQVIDEWTSPVKSPEECLVAVLLQGAVTLSDHAASAHVPLVLAQPVDGAFSTALRSRWDAAGKALFPHQQQASTADGHLLLRAPTGQGKTEAMLLWAAAQVDKLRQTTGGIPRLFYTLPYLASINAMTGRLHADLGETGRDLVGVAHSRAASYYLRLAAEGDCGVPGGDTAELTSKAARQALARNRATRLFREPVRVGTPYQLIRGALAGPKHAGILIDAVNSVFILDELHAYEPRRLGMILAMVRLWTRLGGRVGVASATFPAVLADLLTTALGEKPVTVEPPASWKWPVRHRLNVRSGHLTSPEAIGEIAGQVRDGKSVLVVANNVADAISIYQELRSDVVARYGKDAALLLHARFKAGDRAAIEEKISNRFRAGGPRQPGLLVATQTVEVSLNIDLDILHTSGAPLEPLIQRFGRVNRLGALTGPASVIVHEPAYRPRRNDPGSDYADGVYPAEPVRLAGQILAEHDGLNLDEKIFGQWLDDIYATGWGQEWRAEVEDERSRWMRWLQFSAPFDDRDHLQRAFDELFDGTEAILDEDVTRYRGQLNDHTGAVGRLLAADLLIPLPAYGTALGRWNKELEITVIDGDYDPAEGLVKIRDPRGTAAYSPGEIV
jgi:CRISPR-associated helicase Cas3/CRISPR-associated endonuclease Cas3-HD